MNPFRRPQPESGPTIYRPSESAIEPHPRQYRTLAVEPAQAPAMLPELSLLTRVNQRRGTILTFLVSVAAIGSFCGVVWWAHSQNIEAGGQGLAPIIKADDKPTREKPAHAGGLVVAQQDNEAFSRINPKAAPNPPERLLPPAQQPRPPTPEQLAAAATQPSVDPATARPAALAAPPTPAVSGTPAVAGEPPKVEPAKATPGEAPAGPTISSILEQVSGPVGGWRIQVAAVPNEELARSTWARLQGSHGDVLGQLRMQATRADLGTKGTWYRVQAGPLDEKQAQQACSRLRQRSVECLPVPPAKSGG
jgi:hypothetical protein